MTKKMKRNPATRLKDRIPQKTWAAMHRASTNRESEMKDYSWKRKRIRGVTKDIDEKKGIVSSIISTGELDRDSERVLPGAFTKSIPAFMENPVVLFAHNHDEPPIGQALEVKDTKDGLFAVTQFAREESAFADTIFNLYKGRYLRAWSVGFIPVKWSEDGKDKLPGQMGPSYIESELFEYSGVPVPSNRGALVAMAKSLFASSVMKPDVDHEPPAGEGSKRQSILFLKEKWSVDLAKKWLKDHDLYVDGLDDTEGSEYYRFRQFQPDRCTSQPSTIDIDAEKGIKAVICNTTKALIRNLRTSPPAEKEGRVLSAKNRKIIVTAVTALEEVLAADKRDDEGKARMEAERLMDELKQYTLEIGGIALRDGMSDILDRTRVEN